MPHRDLADTPRRSVVPSGSDTDGHDWNNKPDDGLLKNLDADSSREALSGSQHLLREDRLGRTAAAAPPIFMPDLPAVSATDPPSANARIVRMSSGSSGSGDAVDAPEIRQQLELEADQQDCFSGESGCGNREIGGEAHSAFPRRWQARGAHRSLSRRPSARRGSRSSSRRRRSVSLRPCPDLSTRTSPGSTRPYRAPSSSEMIAEPGEGATRRS